MSELCEVKCPYCHATLWIDLESKKVVQHKKTAKKNTASFDQLLTNEKEKKLKVEERFSLAQDLEKAKKKKAEELFNKSFEKKFNSFRRRKKF